MDKRLIGILTALLIATNLSATTIEYPFRVHVENICDSITTDLIRNHGWPSATHDVFTGPIKSASQSYFLSDADYNQLGVRFYFQGKSHAQGYVITFASRYRQPTSLPVAWRQWYYLQDTALYTLRTIFQFNQSSSAFDSVRTDSFGGVWSITDSIEVNDTLAMLAIYKTRYLGKGSDEMAESIAEFVPSAQAGAIVGPTTGHAANLFVFLKRNNGQPISGAVVTAYLLGTNLRDSSGSAISNQIITERTNSSGVATLTLLWSGYLIPATKWRIQVFSPLVGGFRKDYYVPNQTVDTLDVSQ